jgi:polysaccharide export outer membrane protein
MFVFRFEDPKLVDAKDQSIKPASGKVPVVYEINLRDPASFFVTQNFPVEDHDVIYVSNSPEAELQKFLRLVVTVTSPAATLSNTLR